MEALERAVAGKPDVSKLKTGFDALVRSGKTADRLDSLIVVARDDIQAGESLEWVAGVNLIGGATTYVPFEAVALDRTLGDRFRQSSDGLASGNTFDEAVLHGCSSASSGMPIFSGR
jgi:ribosomal protein S12 methylthiotransferase accessory factor YcaO